MDAPDRRIVSRDTRRWTLSSSTTPRASSARWSGCTRCRAGTRRCLWWLFAQDDGPVKDEYREALARTSPSPAPSPLLDIPDCGLITLVIRRTSQLTPESDTHPAARTPRYPTLSDDGAPTPHSLGVPAQARCCTSLVCRLTWRVLLRTSLLYFHIRHVFPFSLHSLLRGLAPFVRHAPHIIPLPTSPPPPSRLPRYLPACAASIPPLCSILSAPHEPYTAQHIRYDAFVVNPTICGVSRSKEIGGIPTRGDSSEWSSDEVIKQMRRRKIHLERQLGAHVCELRMNQVRRGKRKKGGTKDRQERRANYEKLREKGMPGGEGNDDHWMIRRNAVETQLVPVEHSAWVVFEF
ncbi:hypothetical protein DFH08DRAFT_940184 [Mycena albidolilacea]|uniref:Uncharacterized protein n=1 Tax=Mycena albidolilacea TaxID=1033008 RepID=A0AAD6ZN09_9AGAR|nr:hypothetical protein DFH08DRAFT_940184 [Mycena albidolilacea]